jgi:hypothetical protein
MLMKGEAPGLKNVVDVVKTSDGPAMITDPGDVPEGYIVEVYGLCPRDSCLMLVKNSFEASEPLA